MKTFVTRDYNCQSLLFMIFFTVLILDLILTNGYSPFIYFLIAVNQLVSANYRFFSKVYKKKNLFKVYYFTSMIFIVNLLTVISLSGFHIRNNFYCSYSAMTIFFGIFGTPVLAIFYYSICHYDYKKLKFPHHENVC